MRDSPGDMSIDLTCSHLTVNTIGPPGERVFYLQAGDDERLVTILCEKQQMRLLAEHLGGLLDKVAEDQGADPIEPEPDLSLHEPVEPAFRLGAIGLGYDPERDLIVISCEEFATEDTEDADEAVDGDSDDTEAEEVRLWANRTRARTLVRHIERVVTGGRPVCEFCGNPMDEPHVCPRMN